MQVEEVRRYTLDAWEWAGLLGLPLRILERLEKETVMITVEVTDGGGSTSYRAEMERLVQLLYRMAGEKPPDEPDQS